MAASGPSKTLSGLRYHNLCDLRCSGTYSTGPKTRWYHDDHEFLASYMLEWLMAFHLMFSLIFVVLPFFAFFRLFEKRGVPLTSRIPCDFTFFCYLSSWATQLHILGCVAEWLNKITNKSVLSSWGVLLPKCSCSSGGVTQPIAFCFVTYWCPSGFWNPECIVCFDWALDCGLDLM